MGDILFRDRFRVPSVRLSGWDYGRGGTYCVTICTGGRTCWFGEVRGGEMALSEAGAIVAEEWGETARRRNFVHLDAWVVMPNHFHGILHIDKPRLGARSRFLSEAVSHFKGACTRRIRSSGFPEFVWQSRFYDQIVRSEDVLLRYRRYIQENPSRWEQDRHHPDAPAAVLTPARKGRTVPASDDISAPNVETPRGASPERG